MGATRRFLGLGLAGAKNQKTSLAVLEYYEKQKKTFLLEIFDHIAPKAPQTGDEGLLSLLAPIQTPGVKMGVNVALEFPPCTSCSRKTCPLPAHCSVACVKWMRELNRKALPHPPASRRVLEFTPYTQRPIELWIRYQILPRLSEASQFEIDETLGGNRAPLSARMNFLKRHLSEIVLLETWPKLSVAILATQLNLDRRMISSYRQLENGAHAREEILIALTQSYPIFIYEKDLRKLSLSLTAFDAFICAYTALLSDQGLCAKPPSSFPKSSGWIQYPEF